MTNVVVFVAVAETRKYCQEPASTSMNQSPNKIVKLRSTVNLK